MTLGGQEVNAMSVGASLDPQPERLAATLAKLCERERLDTGETIAVLAVALAGAPGLPRDPTPLLRSFLMTSRDPGS